LKCLGGFCGGGGGGGCGGSSCCCGCAGSINAALTSYCPEPVSDCAVTAGGVINTCLIFGKKEV
jgi:hypothetical protein